MDTFVLLGDSLFQRASSQDKDSTGQTIGSLLPRLSDAYVRKLDILNRGFSGYNTRQILSLSKNFSLSHKPASLYLPPRPRFVVIFLGANDARLPNTPGGPQQHVPLAEFQENLRKIVWQIQRGCEPRHIILITPPPVDERMTLAADSKKDRSLEGVVRRKAIVTAQYARAVRQLGIELGSGRARVKVLDLWGRMIELSGGKEKGKDANEDYALDGDYLDEHGEPLETQAQGSALHLGETTCPGSMHAPVNHELQSHLIDGLHFSRKGYDLLYNELMALIQRHWPDDLPDGMAMAAPTWDDAGRWQNGRLTDWGWLRELVEHARVPVVVFWISIGLVFWYCVYVLIAGPRKELMS